MKHTCCKQWSVKDNRTSYGLIWVVSNRNVELKRISKSRVGTKYLTHKLSLHVGRIIVWCCWNDAAYRSLVFGCATSEHHKRLKQHARRDDICDILSVGLDVPGLSRLKCADPRLHAMQLLHNRRALFHVAYNYLRQRDICTSGMWW